MAISKEQIDSFNNDPLPPVVKENFYVSSTDKKHRGREALVAKGLSHTKTFAFKWYALLSGKSPNELLRYADESNQDEALLQRYGISKTQVPDSQYFIAERNGNPELFALQPWIEGKTLFETPLSELFTNRTVRKSLIDLYLNSARIYPETGVFPDLIGARRLRIAGYEFTNPIDILIPWHSTNIKVNEAGAVLVDAKTIDPNGPFLRRQLLKVNRVSTILFAQSLRVYDAFDQGIDFTS